MDVTDLADIFPDHREPGASLHDRQCSLELVLVDDAKRQANLFESVSTRTLHCVQGFYAAVTQLALRNLDPRVWRQSGVFDPSFSSAHAGAGQRQISAESLQRGAQPVCNVWLGYHERRSGRGHRGADHQYSRETADPAE